MSRVAYLVNTYPAPTHTFIRREIEALEALGRPITRYALRRPAGAALEGEAEKVRTVHDVGVVGGLRALQRVRVGGVLLALRLGRGAPGGIVRHLFYLIEACVLRAWTEADDIDHVHVHFGTNGVAVAMLLEALGGPGYSFTAHGPEEFDHPQELKLAEKVARARFVATISSYGRSQVLRWSDPAHWDRVHIVRCAVDRDYLDRPITPVPDIPRLVSVGRLAPEKGQTLLLEAIARLHAAGVPVELVVIGDGDLRAELESHDVEGVRFTGWLDNATVADEVVASRALVLPSFAEGLPVSLMEALALGRPVVTTAVAGIPELVIHGVSGWVVPPSSVDDLVDAMRAALRTPVADLDRMGEAGATAVAERHDASIEAAKLHALFDVRAA